MTTATRTIEVDERFNLDETLRLNTQDFRWDCWRDDTGADWHSGVLSGHLIHIRQERGALTYRASAGANLDVMLRSYFRLDEDIKAIHQELASVDSIMAKLVKDYPHMRVLHQPDPWETTVAFICSAKKSPKGIAATVEKIAEGLGRWVHLAGDRRRAFPSFGDVLASRHEIEDMSLGLRRGQHVLAAAERLRQGGPPWEYLSHSTYGEVRWELDRFPGIGGKIADCIALFSLGKHDAFPVDSRVRRALGRHYEPTEGVSDDTLVLWGREYFNEHAGYASQLLYLDGGAQKP